MAKTTSDLILGEIQKESWILDHFEIFVKWGIRETATKPNMVLPPGEQHGVGGGLRSLTAFLVKNIILLLILTVNINTSWHCGCTAL